MLVVVKDFFLKDLKEFNNSYKIYGIDISKYALKNAHPDVKKFLSFSSANKLKWKDNYFDLVVSFNTLHNLYNYDLFKSLQEIERVAKKYIVVESYRNEKEK